MMCWRLAALVCFMAAGPIYADQIAGFHFDRTEFDSPCAFLDYFDRDWEDFPEPLLQTIARGEGGGLGAVETAAKTAGAHVRISTNILDAALEAFPTWTKFGGTQRDVTCLKKAEHYVRLLEMPLRFGVGRLHHDEEFVETLRNFYQAIILDHMVTAVNVPSKWLEIARFRTLPRKEWEQMRHEILETGSLKFLSHQVLSAELDDFRAHNPYPDQDPFRLLEDLYRRKKGSIEDYVVELVRLSRRASGHRRALLNRELQRVLEKKGEISLPRSFDPRQIGIRVGLFGNLGFPGRVRAWWRGDLNYRYESAPRGRSIVYSRLVCERQIAGDEEEQ